jgi:cytochrome c-type biogenesis protein CcmH/NrfG
MLIEASITGLFRMVVFIAAALIIIRFMSQLLAAKRSAAESKEFERKKKVFEKTKQAVEKQKGRVRILGKTSNTHSSEYVDYEEIK